MSQTSIPAGSPMAIKVNATAPKGKGKGKKAQQQEAPIEKKVDSDEDLLAAMEMEDIGNLRYIDIKSMDKAALQAHAMRTFGRRYADDETESHMRDDIQNRMAMRAGMQRYR